MKTSQKYNFIKKQLCPFFVLTHIFFCEKYSTNIDYLLVKNIQLCLCCNGIFIAMVVVSIKYFETHNYSVLQQDIEKQIHIYHVINKENIEILKK